MKPSGFARRHMLAWMTVALLLAVGSPAVAQDRNADLDALRREIEELRRSDAEKQKRLDELHQKLETLSAPAATQPAQPSASSPHDPPTPQLPATSQSSAADEVSSDAIHRDIFSTQSDGKNFRLLDVSLSVMAAGGGSTERDESLQTLQGGGHDPRKRGFTLQNTELSLSGAVDPYFTGEARVIYFIDPLEGESIFELEEAFITTSSLPYGLELEAGQMFTEFGRINPRHPHQWEWMDQPIINSRLFGPDGLRQLGVRLGWRTPLAWHSEFHFGAQNANGETAASFLANGALFEERAVGGRSFVDRGVRSLKDLLYLLRWENAFDLSAEWRASVGVSTLFGPNSTGPDGRTAIHGADLVVDWRPVQNHREWPFLTWQSEVMYRDYRADAFAGEGIFLAGETFKDYGFYTQVLYGFAPRSQAGVRFEYASGSGESIDGRENDAFRDDRYRVSPLIEFLLSEFSRIRLQHNYDDADHLAAGDAHSIWVGFEYLIGSHSAHRH